jgi:uncharacterized protein
MKWSRYNYIFKSDRFGYLLYNALSNSLASVDDATFAELELIRKSSDEYKFTQNPALLLQLRISKILVEDGEEQEALNTIRMLKVSESFAANVLDLTILPTLFCNFACTYCYEKFKRPVHMSEAVENGVVSFIRRFRRLDRLFIDWFGGEPLLRFDTICRISETLKALAIPFKADITTNGYLLNETVVRRLTDLNIRLVQVTIDGLADVHDTRKPLQSGGKTFETIVTNLERLAASWDGSVLIRVNVDHANAERFQETHDFLSKRIQGKKVVIGPAAVVPTEHPHASCFCRTEDAEFRINAYRQYGIYDAEFYPGVQPRTCIATRRNGFVIGPEGEIYKCWLDIGSKDMIVGDIFGNIPWNTGATANYLVGADHFEDPKCKDCFFLPICDGGCPNTRLHSMHSDQDTNVCLIFKDRLQDWLEIYYELRQKQKVEHPSVFYRTETHP